MSTPRGLHWVHEVIDEATEAALVKAVDAAPWNTTLRRRVQQYGHAYVYSGRSSASVAPVPPCPSWARDLLTRCQTAGLPVPSGTEVGDDLMVIVNEYVPGQGIRAHVDDPEQFGDWVLTVSLGSACVMRFAPRATPATAGDESRGCHVELPRRSAYLMTGPARYEWTHEIPARKTDVVNGRRVARTRRVSVTFRVQRRSVLGLP